MFSSGVFSLFYFHRVVSIYYYFLIRLPILPFNYYRPLPSAVVAAVPCMSGRRAAVDDDGCPSDLAKAVKAVRVRDCRRRVNNKSQTPVVKRNCGDERPSVQTCPLW